MGGLMRLSSMVGWLSTLITKSGVNAQAAAKLVCVLLVFAPQWGLAWQTPDFNPDSFGGTAPSLWVTDELSSFIEHARYVQAAIYAVVCAVTLGGLLVVPFIASNWLRISLLIGLCVGWIVELVILDINGTFSNQSMLLTLYGVRQEAADLWYYKREFMRDGMYVLALSIILFMPPSRPQLSKKWAVVPLISLGITGGIIWKTKGGTQVFPIPMSLLANAASISLSVAHTQVHPLVTDLKPNRAFALPPAQGRGLNRIIMIMDESVRGDYLSINDPTVDTTPFLRGDPDVINFGVAISGANCSSFTRLMFRFGMREDDVYDWAKALNRPNMWDYAKHAGYNTIFIDTYAGPFQDVSGFSPIERQQIDKKISVLDSPIYLRDAKIAQLISQITSDTEDKIFLYVDKFGTHVPYDNKYPADINRFKYVSDHDNVKEETIVEYKNAIYWEVDRFFERLARSIDLDHTLLIYTSDHGQSLFEGGYKQSHCSVNGQVAAGEGIVPLIAMTHAEPFNSELRAIANRDFSHFSHSDVFPTLLTAMGYARQWVQTKYNSSMLYGPHAASRGFFVGNPKASMRRIDVE
jgi:glucan phosphoethanolaminetransferase (alkaline phosphatase superfamily)